MIGINIRDRSGCYRLTNNLERGVETTNDYTCILALGRDRDYFFGNSLERVPIG